MCAFDESDAAFFLVDAGSDRNSHAHSHSYLDILTLDSLLSVPHSYSHLEVITLDITLTLSLSLILIHELFQYLTFSLSPLSHLETLTVDISLSQSHPRNFNLIYSHFTDSTLFVFSISVTSF